MDFGLKYVPKSPQLLAQSAKLDALQTDLQAKAAQESADAEVTSRIDSMRSAVAADAVSKATQSLDRIKVLQPNKSVPQDGSAPQLLATAYLAALRHVPERALPEGQADVLGQSLKSPGSNAELRATKARYDVVAAIMAAGKQPLASADYDN